MPSGVSNETNRPASSRDLLPRPLDDRLARQEPAGDAPGALSATRADSSATVDGLDPQTVYNAYRRQIEHEDNLMTSRASWLLMAQSFFVMAYAVLHQLAPPDPHTQPVTALLGRALAVVGWLTCVLILLAVLAAAGVMRRLRNRFGAECRAWPALARQLAHLPALQPTGTSLWLGRLPSVGLPILFLAFWTLMLCATLLR